MIQTVALFGPHMLGLLTLVAALLPALASPAARWRSRRCWSPQAGASAPGGWRSRCRRGRSRCWCGWCSPNADQALKWQPGMAQEFYERHLALTRRGEPRADVTIWSETAVPFLLDQRPSSSPRRPPPRRRAR